MYNNNNNNEDKGFCSTIWSFLMLCGSVLTFIRNFIGNLVMLLFFLLIFVAIQFSNNVKDFKSGSKSTNLIANDNPVVVFNLAGYISEKPLSFNELDQIQRLIVAGNNQEIHELYKIKEALNAIKKDDNIKSVILYLDNLQPISMHVASSIAKEIKAIKDSGKEIHAYSNYYTQSAYLIASAASSISMDPFGEIDFKGVALNNLYFKDFLDKILLNAKVFRAGEYKSATEPFTQNYMSPHVKLEYINIANHIFSQYKLEVAKYRDSLKKNPIPTSSAVLGAKLREVNGDMSAYQLKMGYVDKLQSKMEFNNQFISLYGSKFDDPYMFSSVDYQDYLDVVNLNAHSFKQKVAVIYGIGEIYDEANTPDDFAPENLIPQILKAKDDKSVKAVVFYVNSGGGSVMASEKIRRALLELSKEKPLVVSMNGVAASGGYWISTPAHKILATEESLTGSIGVFGISFKANQLINEFGVHKDGVSTSDLADDDMLTPHNQGIEDVLQQSVDSTYKKFINLVATSRNIDANNYKSFAEGQVFVAPVAKSLKLIDELGTFDDALNVACKLADLNRENTTIKHMSPEVPPLINNIEKIFFKGASAYIPRSILKDLLNIKDHVRLFDLRQDKITLAITTVEDVKM